MSIKNHLQNNTFYLLFSRPNLYLKELLWRTILIGLVTLAITMGLHLLDLDAVTIPASMHSLVGIVIGLLLVFRSNTAYDRWWEGRKTISAISQEISMVSARLNVLEKTKRFNPKQIEQFRNHINEFLVTLRDYLKSGHDGEESLSFHIKQKNAAEKALGMLASIETQDTNTKALNASIGKLIEYSNTLERIKNTPIPLSYMLHIKMSILLYLITLPIGMFHDLGIWGTPLVMLVYYIIAGVDIISREIENPFADDPNDLPTAKLFKVIIKTLWDKEKVA